MTRIDPAELRRRVSRPSTEKAQRQHHGSGFRKPTLITTRSSNVPYRSPQLSLWGFCTHEPLVKRISHLLVVVGLAATLFSVSIIIVHADSSQPESFPGIDSVEYPTRVLVGQVFRVKATYDYVFSKPTNVFVAIVAGEYQDRLLFSMQLASCNQLVNGSGKGLCSLALASGEEKVWTLTVYVSVYDSLSNSWVYQRYGAKTITVKVGSHVRFIIRVSLVGPPLKGMVVPVNVEGIIQPLGVGGEARFSVFSVGGVNVTLPPNIAESAGVRAGFDRWSDGSRQYAGKMWVKNDTVLTAWYKTQYGLTINSAYGEPWGAGWYDAGSTANIGVSQSVTHETLGFFGVVHRFLGWTGNVSETTPEASVRMDGPKTVTARWMTDYSPVMLIAGVSLAGLGLVWKLGRPQRHGVIVSTTLPKKGLKFCRWCGTKIPRDSVFCEECGTSLG